MDAEEEKGIERGSVQRNISRRLVGLHKEFYGKGPTKAKTYYVDDAVFVLLRGGFSKVEETLLAEGRGDAVVRQRMEFQEIMLGRYSEVIESETGRKVIAFMSGNHQHPDVLAEVFILDSTDLLDDELDDPEAGPTDT